MNEFPRRWPCGRGAQHDLGRSLSGQPLMGLLGVGARYGVPLPCSRLQASEADMLRLDLMAKAGFDPRESINLRMNVEQASGAEPVEFV